jgi:thymidylate kinase
MSKTPKDSHQGRALREILIALEEAGHRTCVLHGYKAYPEYIASDVEIVSDAPAQIPCLLSGHRVAAVVRARRFNGNYTDYRFILHKRYGADNVFLTFDASADYRLFGLLFFRGKEFLEACRPFKFFNVPPADLEFCSYLIRRILKGSLDQAQAQRLTELYREDPQGCAERLGGFFQQATARLIVDSANTGDWTPVRVRLDSIRRELLSRVVREQPLRFSLHRLGTLWRRLGKRLEFLVWPPGLMVTFLGVDGAGKSTVIPRVERDLSPAFAHTKRYHKRSFRSALNWMRPRQIGEYRPQARSAHSEESKFIHDPHTRPPRRLAASLAKLAFWWVDYGLLGYATDIYPSLARSTLVLFDRYYHDLIVDAKRYRYGGPMWAVQLVSRLIPRPDLVILLDAPPEVLYARKQEFPFAEARRQREAYLDLVKGLSNGYVIDASKPLDQVVAEAEQVILEYLARRTARRFGCSNARPQSSFP